ncbi:MAG: CinA family protein, partial [Turicibacter sp.]
ICEQIISMLKNKSLTIATAESCSGGLLASRLVNVSGASSVFLEGVVTYSYESKMKRLNIDEKRLMSYGAVSNEIAHDMAYNLSEMTHADVSVGITGIAGPDGGTELKPVGLVYIAINVSGQMFINSYIFNGDREKIRQQTVAQTLYLLHNYIKTL